MLRTENPHYLLGLKAVAIEVMWSKTFEKAYSCVCETGRCMRRYYRKTIEYWRLVIEKRNALR